ncbi:MAG: hypothetical protein RLZZ561_208 [Pseudomonadota bacterium]|jgi:hydroxypyruvate reductase
MQAHRDMLTGYFLAGIAAASARHALPSRLPTVPPIGRTILLGCGKAAAEMAAVAIEHLDGAVIGCVVTRQGHSVPVPPAGITLIEARHPVPDQSSREAGRHMLDLAASAGPDDRVLFLISGGGSALLSAPADGIDFEEKQKIGDALVRSGCPIEDMNLVRRHLSAIKGGRLAALAGRHGADMVTYIISDVTSEDPALVASGPSLAAPFEPEQAIEILGAAGWPVSPALAAAIHANSPPAAMPHPVHVLATNGDALDAVAARARLDGWTVVDLGRALTGHAADIGQAHAAIAADYARRPGRFLLLSGGELTVERARKDGRGGPNLEYLAGLMSRLDPDLAVHALAGDTDGIDGTQDNAGGYFAAQWVDHARAQRALSTNQTYDLFTDLGGLIITGPTRTNVNDIRMIAVEGILR